MKSHERSILVTDLNARLITREANEYNNKADRALMDIINETNLTLYVIEEATRCSEDERPKATIDLIISKHVTITNQKIHNSMDSYHRSMSFEIG